MNGKAKKIKMSKRTVGIIARISALIFILIAFSTFSTIGLSTILCYFDSPHNNWFENNIIAAILISVIFGGLLSFIIAVPIIKKLVQTSDAVKEVEQGNFEVSLDEKQTFRELSELCRSFNAMTKQLRETEFMRREFISDVSHEFKTPLSSINGYASLLKKDNLSDEKRIEYINKIIAGTKQLDVMTGNILLLSKLDSGKINLEKETYLLDEHLREILVLYEHKLSEKNLELEIELEECEINANKDLLTHVWQNLLSNAVKFSGSGGKITVSAKKKNGFIFVCFSDEGIGMSDEVRRRVFEKFYQGDSSHSTSGNGLGLALAKRIVDLHGGEITVESEENKGSTFTVKLPSEC
ncbi:MAG: ATP-binding protein [Acutalibacteraceae bacterium]